MSYLRRTQRAAFLESFGVGAPAMAALDQYVALLDDWQGRMNLIGPATSPEIWTRHIADSAQLVALAPNGPWLDIGSGAGFPGLVAAVLGATPVHLVESVGKKARFLETVTAELALPGVTVHNARVESIPAFPASTITARACAPLAQLFDWGLRFAGRETYWLLLKGASVAAELDAARKAFIFDAELIPSSTNSDARIVRAFHVKRR